MIKMVSKSLEVFSKSIGMNIAEDCIYGIYGGFFMTVSEKRTTKNVDISCFIGNSDEYYEDYASINDAIRDVLDKYIISDYKIEANRLSVSSHAELSIFREMIDYLVSMLDELDIYNSDYCSECGEKIEDKKRKRIVTIKTSKESYKKLVCDSCALEYAEKEHDERLPAEEIKERCLRGVLCSAAAAFLGCVIYVLICYFTGVHGRGSMARFIPCLAATLIGAGAALGYKLTAGKFSLKGIVSLSVITGVFTLLAHFAGCVCGYFTYLSGKSGISASATFKYALSSVIKLQFNDSKNLSFLIIGAVISLCCAFICVIFIYGMSIKRKESGKKISVSIQSVK